MCQTSMTSIWKCRRFHLALQFTARQNKVRRAGRNWVQDCLGVKCFQKTSICEGSNSKLMWKWLLPDCFSTQSGPLHQSRSQPLTAGLSRGKTRPAWKQQLAGGNWQLQTVDKFSRWNLGLQWGGCHCNAALPTCVCSKPAWKSTRSCLLLVHVARSYCW